MNESEASSAAPATPLHAASPALRSPALWKSVEAMSDPRSFDEFIRREYPSQVHKLVDAPARREFLKLMGASLALAGASSCTRQPLERILPYAKNPESTIPGVPLFYATAMPWATGAIGLLVESHMGRPTKVEGNPDHPASLGATDSFAQAAALAVYDPDRSKVIRHRGRIGTWGDFLTDLQRVLVAAEAKQGDGLRILTETVVSPTLAGQLRDVRTKFPKVRWHQYEPVNRDSARAGAISAFGRDVQARPSFAEADVIVSLDCDFLSGGPELVRRTREFAERRRAREGGAPLNRLYVVESAHTNTGAMADHRMALRQGSIAGFAVRLAEKLGVALAGASALPDAVDAKRAERIERWATAVAQDLTAHAGRSLILVGESQAPHVHALVHLMNQALGNVGRTVVHTEPVECESVDQRSSLAALVSDMRSGAVDALVILGANPVYTSPADLDFKSALARVAWRVHLGLYEDETAELCDWHIPEAHFLESWSDARAEDGGTSIVQPLIAPLYGGKTSHEVVAAMQSNATATSYDLVREHWKGALGEVDFEKRWRRALHDGVIADTEFAASTLRASAEKINVPATRGGAAAIEIVFRPDPTVWDGRFANNGWLQELPKPLTKLTWDNAAELSPSTAARLALANEDVVEIECGGRKVQAPVWIVPGHADECVIVHVGYGRTRAGALGSDVGFDAFRLQSSEGVRSAPATIRKTGTKHKLASTQEHDNMEGRDIVRVGTVDRFRENPSLSKEAAHHGAESTSLYPPHPRGDYAWGMVIDLNACTACGACVTACQSENNVPIVGKEEVRRGREMHWIRIDRYFEGPKEEPAAHFQPVTCMHCENAPCEVVCPVGATTHSDEGLNEMTYNRCVGTRYCANNCPYKVRRFNFFKYADYETGSLKLGRNPDVTVRSRGVMEKCTYCVQRINAARITAKKEDRTIRDGDVRTACQAVCPAQAIVFGDVDDPASAVSLLKSQPHNYGLLEELNTRPRTSYLAKIKNPNPALEA